MMQRPSFLMKKSQYVTCSSNHNTLPTARVGVYLLFVSILASSSGSLDIHDFFPEERDALIQLRDNVYSSCFNLHQNWTGPPCDKNSSSRWAGVRCSDWHVTHLVLEDVNLTGSLYPTTLQNLTFLTKLSFRNNNLNGPLPYLTNLVRLEQVFLSRNQFSGSIPSGYIDLPDLIGLELQENDLSGLIPPFDQQSLVTFNVSHNHLQGKVPETPVLHRFTKSSFDNNSGLCGGGLIIGLNPCPNPIPEAPLPPSKGKHDSRHLKSWSIVVIVVAAAFIPLCMGLIFLCYCSRTACEHNERWRKTIEPFANRTPAHAYLEFVFFIVITSINCLCKLNQKFHPEFLLCSQLRASS